jgi:hypothetical protein
VEVASPNATYELVVKTEMKTGTTVPRGRITLPRPPKPKTEDRILVFAEGREAEDAKKAGAHIVGGPELIDAVRSPSILLNPITHLTTLQPGRRQPASCYYDTMHTSSHSSHHPKARAYTWPSRLDAFRETRYRDR